MPTKPAPAFQGLAARQLGILPANEHVRTAWIALILRNVGLGDDVERDPSVDLEVCVAEIRGRDIEEGTGGIVAATVPLEPHPGVGEVVDVQLALCNERAKTGAGIQIPGEGDGRILQR